MSNPLTYRTFLKPSVVSLVIANMIPLIGVLFFGWSILQIMILYWAESGVIGFYNVLKIIIISRLKSIVFVPFFIIHYGGFMFGHLMFILFLFAPGLIGKSLASPSSKIFLYSLLIQAVFPIAALFISHGISFYSNFIKNREYDKMGPGKKIMQLIAPYGRIIVTHITLAVGGLLILLLGNPVFGLVPLIIAKIIVDIGAHLKEHHLQDLIDLNNSKKFISWGRG